MRLTKNYLKRLVKEEMTKNPPLAKADEVDADEFADTLEKKIDYVKALKIEESRLGKRINKLKTQRSRTISEIRSNPTLRRKIIAENDKRMKEAGPVIQKIKKLLPIGGTTGEYLKEMLGKVADFAGGGFNWKGLFSLGMADTPIEKAKEFVDGLDAGLGAVGNHINSLLGKEFFQTDYSTLEEAFADMGMSPDKVYSKFEGAWKKAGDTNSDLPAETAFQDLMELEFSTAARMVTPAAPKASYARQMSRKKETE